MKTDATRLVVVPWREQASIQPLVNGLEALVRRGVVDRERAVVARWHGDDMCLAPAVGDAAADLDPLVPRWRSVLRALFDHPVIEWAGAACSPTASPVVEGNDLSTSFVREVRESIPPGTTFLAFVADASETSTIVREFARVRATRMIYGAVPANWFTPLDDCVG